MNADRLNEIREEALNGVTGAKADREASDLRFNETLLAAIEAGWTFRKLSVEIGMGVGWLHKRVQRAKQLRPKAIQRDKLKKDASSTPMTDEEYVRSALKRLNPAAYQSDYSWHALSNLLAALDAAEQQAAMLQEAYDNCDARAVQSEQELEVLGQRMYEETVPKNEANERIAHEQEQMRKMCNDQRAEDLARLAQAEQERDEAIAEALIVRERAPASVEARLAERVQTSNWSGPLAEDFAELEARAEAAEVLNTRYETALAFYAAESTYEEASPSGRSSDGTIPIREDEGSIARAALAASSAGKPTAE